MSEEEKQEAVPPAAVETPAASAGEAAPAARTRARVSRRVPSVDKVAARHQKALADAAKTAKAVKLAQPAKVTKVASTPASDSAVKAKPVKAAKPAKVEKVAKNGKAAKAEKPAKPRKLKLVRDSFAMPEAEYAKIAELKKRLAALGSEVKKSELLRGGVAVLAALNDAELKAVMARIERIKTGRPAKR